MKKLLANLLVIVMLVSVAIPVSASSLDAEAELNSYQLAFIRLTSKGESEKETAEKILSTVGMPQEQIDNISEDKLSEIALATSIVKTTEYCLIDADDNETVLTEEEYLSELEKLENPSGTVSTNELHYSGTDSLFVKNLYIYETLNAPKGTYGIIGTFEWKNLIGKYRGEEILSLSGESLVFDLSSFLLTVSLNYKVVQNSKTTEDTKTENFTISNYEKIWGYANAVACAYNLPNDALGTTSMLSYLNGGFMMFCSARVSNPDLKTVFNVYCNYFHQKVGVGSAGVSVSAKGASVSVSPKAFYSKSPYQIQTSSQLVYNP